MNSVTAFQPFFGVRRVREENTAGVLVGSGDVAGFVDIVGVEKLLKRCPRQESTEHGAQDLTQEVIRHEAPLERAIDSEHDGHRRVQVTARGVRDASAQVDAEAPTHCDNYPV